MAKREPSHWPEGFEKFFLDNYPKVKNFALKLLMSEQDAEDIAQDIFLKLMDKPGIWKDREQSNRYMYTMTKNYIINIIRHRQVERRYQENAVRSTRLAEELGLESYIQLGEIELIIQHTVEHMPAQRGAVFKMSRFEGLSNPEIAEILELSIRTVERHLYLALLDLKKALNYPAVVE